MSKTIQARMIQKHATEEEWNSSSMVPNLAEIIVYDPDVNHKYSRFKIGDGVRTAIDLPFFDKGESVHHIVGNGDTAGVWTGTCENITEYYDGLTILFKLNVAGVSAGSTLNINGLGACEVRRNATTAVTTTYPAGSIVMLTYSGGVWFTADYDADTKTSAGTSNKIETKMYLLGGTSQDSNGITTYTNENVYIGSDNRLYSNGVVVPNTDEINAMIDAKLAEIPSASGVSF